MGSALVRAFLIMVLAAMPSVILPGVSDDTRQVVALVALFVGALTFTEYSATYPSLLEFRDAPPFNRIRFCALFVLVVSLSFVLTTVEAPSSVGRMFEAFAFLVGSSLDFPYSPVRLATLMLSDDASASQVVMVRSVAGMSYVISLMSLAIFVVMLKLRSWPLRHQAFNVWVNLPTFEPTGTGDVVDRLERDARINITIGFLLPFVVPLLVRLLSDGINLSLDAPQVMIWLMAAWSFVPAVFLMRGMAMGRIAAMIRVKRAANGARADHLAAA